jgi:hypothetical protein
LVEAWPIALPQWRLNPSGARNNCSIRTDVTNWSLANLAAACICNVLCQNCSRAVDP